MRIKYLIIDSIDKNKVICEDENKKQLFINCSQIKKPFKEGDFIFWSKDKNIYLVDSKKTKEKKDEINNLFKKLIE